MNLQKRLYVSRQNRMLTGTCGGIAEFLHIDPSLVRIAFVLLALLDFDAAVLLYIMLWIIMPLPPREKAKRKNSEWDKHAEAVTDRLAVPASDFMSDYWVR